MTEAADGERIVPNLHPGDDRGDDDELDHEQDGDLPSNPGGHLDPVRDDRVTWWGEGVVLEGTDEVEATVTR